jgi:hypothetical protein
MRSVISLIGDGIRVAAQLDSNAGLLAVAALARLDLPTAALGLVEDRLQD